ncbi:MAG TPA: hypothetical protein VFR68_04695 [Candidatus Dormibacteraeota bacterium]|nr:hypothetical protein [Candidatus Dormibacteraeota bacterium]
MKVAAPLVAMGLLLSACGASTPATGGSDSSQLQAQVIATELVAGAQERIPIGILDHNTPVNDATVHVRAFVLQNGNTGVIKGESAAPFEGQGLEGKGVYVAHLDLTTAGNWGLEITASRPNGESMRQNLPINVVSAPIVPAVGQPAPPSHSPTVRDQPDASYIDSGRPPDDMHQVSIAEAIQQHRPTLVIFATPAFCTSQTCGPEVHVVQGLEPAYKNRLTFIHVEIYTNFKPDPSKKQIAPTVAEWRLQSEPWIFLIDSKGIIQARFEGPTASDEIKAAIDQLPA